MKEALPSLFVGAAFMWGVVVVRLFPVSRVGLAMQLGLLAGALVAAGQAVYFLAIHR
jgi:hypothetical protein